MEIRNYYQKMNEIYGKLQDEESRKLFEARIAYLIERDKHKYILKLGEIYKDWYSVSELQTELDQRKYEEIIIFGCGYLGMMLQGMLLCMGYHVDYFCDNYHAGEELDNVEVISVTDVISGHSENSLIIIGSYQYQDEMYQQLCDLGIKKNNILKCSKIELFGKRGFQYFDVFLSCREEVFVDAGTFDGETIFDFCKWTNGNYKKIVAFEPISEMCKKIETAILDRGLEKIQLINAATWNRNEEIKFADAGASSCMDEAGSVAVQGVTIDSVVKDEKVTYIKMDIEGSELKALEGAQEMILRDHPRLAICIYHKPMDIIEIPSYILSLVPEYKFYIRHYTSNMWETVLYAECM